MNILADRFRKWYEYERDCNAKTLAMLASVPVDRQSEPGFQKALDKLGHLDAARRRWLHRLGGWPDFPVLFPERVTLESLTKNLPETEAAWVAYLGRVDDAELTREFDYTAWDDKKYRWNVEGVLTQVFGHAWYHRGQIASLVAVVGGKAVDTDYVFWCKPKPLE